MMNRKILVTVVSGLAIGAVAMPAAAQVSKPIGLSIRAGVDFPTSNGNGTALFGAGLEFAIQNLNMGSMGPSAASGHLSISADYYGKNNSYAIPILLNAVGTSQEFFYSVGAGVADSHNGGNGNNRWDFAYQLGLGYNFAQSQTPLFLEAKYFGNSRSEFNVIGIYLGIRL